LRGHRINRGASDEDIDADSKLSAQQRLKTASASLEPQTSDKETVTRSVENNEEFLAILFLHTL